jgi:hypothetical protein
VEALHKVTASVARQHNALRKRLSDKWHSTSNCNRSRLHINGSATEFSVSPEFTGVEPVESVSRRGSKHGPFTTACADRIPSDKRFPFEFATQISASIEVHALWYAIVGDVANAICFKKTSATIWAERSFANTLRG